MTYQLAALRFRSIGERSARFTDLTLSLTAPADDGPAPQDSVIWLRNGGGKSSILSLLYAQLLPRAYDFMGRTVQRSLTDYIDSGDTSHVVALWQPSNTARTLSGEPEVVLVTGAVHEWTDLRRPAQAAESRDRLNTYFYAFHAISGVLDLTTLPFADTSGRPRRLASFMDALREQARPHARHANLAVTDKQHVWTKALLDRHLDPEIFRTQKQMNHVEGGVEDLFKFPAAKDFIDFLLDLTTQPDAADSIAKRLASVTALLAAKPHKIDERDFCTAAAGDLDEVAARHEQVRAAADELSTASNAAARLAAAFASAVAAAEQEQQQLKKQHEAISQARTTANNDRSTANDLLYLYRREAARLRLSEAQAEEKEATSRAEEASALARAWEVALQLADLAELKGALAQAELEAAAEEAELAPLRDEHARHAALLRLRLEALAEEADFAADLADEQQQTAKDTAAEEQGLAEQARAEQREAAANEAAARTQLDMLDQRRRDGVTRGHLPTVTTSAETHLATSIAQRDGFERKLAEIAAQAEIRRRRRREISSRETVLAGEHSSADATRTSTAARRAELGERLTNLTSAPRLRELLEATEDETVDLWAEAPLLQRRLSDAVIAADEERVLRRAEQHADQRTIEAQEHNQILPSSLDAEHVQRELGPAITAQTGWEYLRSVMSADHLVGALDIPGIARLGCGVVVPTNSAADAVRALDAQGVLTTSLVGVYTAEAADTLIHSAESGIPDAVAPAWTGLQPGLVDPVEADAAVRMLKERAHAYQLKDQELARQREIDDELRREATRFIKDCPTGHLTTLDNELDRLDRKLKDVQDEQEAVRLELQGLDAADRLNESAQKAIEEKNGQLGITVGWLEDLIPVLATESLWTERLANAQRRGTDADSRATAHADNHLKAVITAQQYETTASTERLKAQSYRSEGAGIPATSHARGWVGNLADDPRTPLDTLRRNERTALRALESRASQSVLADRVQGLSQRVAAAEQKAGLLAADDRHFAAQMLASPDGQEPQLRSASLELARQDERKSAATRGAAQGKVEQRRIDLDAVERQYRNPPRRTLPIVPAISAQAEALAAEQESLSQQAQDRVSEAEGLIESIDRQAGQIRTRQQLLCTLLESLPATDGTDLSQNVVPFTDNEDAAREHARNARDSITAADKKASMAESGLITSVDRLRRTAGRFAKISGPMKDRVSNDPPSLLGPHANDLAAKLRLRAQTLTGELDSIAKDQIILSEALAHLAKESLDMLGKAERGSQMNTASGSWAGRKILRISFDRPDDGDLVVYAERVIDRTVQKGLKAEGMPLLKAAVHEASGPRGFTVKVLKPSDDATATTEDISRLAKWSGGEKLTVCVALYCTLAALRAAHTGRTGRSGGVLLLDNPIGRASSASLVRLQRDVAASHGVQLVYTTGVKDPAAVIQFPNVIRLDNREGRTRNRRYIIAEESESVGADVAGIRVAHADHPWESATTPQQRAG
jgi:hypothetical protein